MARLSPVRFVLSDREYESLRDCFVDEDPRRRKRKDLLSRADKTDTDFNAAAFRSASRVFVGTTATLQLLQTVLNQVANRDSKGPPRQRKPMIKSKTKLALSLSSLLFFHRILFRLFKRLRLQLMHEQVRNIRRKYPKLYAVLTSHLAPAIGASLSGFALGICPADQLRVTVALYIACRALELAYTALDSAGYITNKPWWFGSWLLFPLAQGQLLHSFVFDRDCFPEAYGTFILQYTPEYIQRKPAELSSKVIWPNSNQIVDALAEVARLRWPPFISPILHPNDPNTLPKSINQVVAPLVSRAHPALEHLSCALIHPSETSCFMAYLRQNLIAFPQLARFFTMYYGALSLFRIGKLNKEPVEFLSRLAKQILKTTLAISGAIGASWGSICLFNAILPRSFLPQFRFFIGGLMGGMFQIFDQTAAGHGNALYAARTSVDSLWKVGVKKRWWRGIKGGDVWLFVASLALVNVIFDLEKNDEVERKDRALSLIKVLRGEVEVGLQRQKMDTPSPTERTRDKRQYPKQ